MTKLETLQKALNEQGEPSAEEIAQYFQQRYGIHLNPRRVPVLRASRVEKATLDRVA